MTAPATDRAASRTSRLTQRILGDRDLRGLLDSETAKAAGLAGAMIANNVIALISTVVFARLLTDYGSLAALVSYFLILSVAGQALQVATAREGVLGHLGVGAALAATVKRWTVILFFGTLVISVISVLLRDPISQAVGVPHDQWAAAVGLPAAMLWLELAILRGVLQGVGDYKGVGISLIGEQGARLITGALLVVAGLGVTGAYLGTPLSFIAMCIFCGIRLRQYVEKTAARPVAAAGVAPAQVGLWTHIRRAWAPIAGLIVIAVLQNIDIIAAKHRFTSPVASSYGATAVAAKVLIWVAIGGGFYLVPEASRRHAAGEDTRPVLFVALGIVAVCSIPVLLIFGFEPRLLLRLAFGPKRLLAANSLFVLGAAFTVLAATYLAVQYMLALRRTWFLLALGAVAVAEPILLLNASRRPTGFATVVLGIQAVGAVLAFAMALRHDKRPAVPPSAPPPGAREDSAAARLPEPVEL